MILQSLVKHYETLVQDGKVTEQGWCTAKVSYGIQLNRDGLVSGIIDLRVEEERGKKKVLIPQEMKVPQMVSRSSGVLPNFLCDNAKYLLGVDKEERGEKKEEEKEKVKAKAIERFEAAKKLHLEYLENVDTEIAEAIKKFFLKWNPEHAGECEALNENWDGITAGGNLIFCMGPVYAQDDTEIRNIWKEILFGRQGAADGICLVTGKESQIARIHTVIKGVQGAQSSGAALVSFNAPAFESYGKEQSYNAPVGEYAAFAYTTALNYLLSQKKYVFRFGDTTVLFWAEDGEEMYQEFFSFSLEPEPDNQEEIKGVFQALKENRPVVVKDIRLNPEQKFYILGLAPNAARLSVRFFYEDSFGSILKNLGEHYERMDIMRPSWDSKEYLGVNAMVQETVNQNSKDKLPKPNMAAATFQAILAGSRYPESLYGQVLLRIRSEQGRITRGRAAIIKAYLIKNKNKLKEGDFVRVNEKENNCAYVLGRLFAVLEQVQETANPGINATIKDRYYNAASTTPATVFPILIRLKNSHIRKLDKPTYLEIQLTELMGKINKFPVRLSLEEQGDFALGYYHQIQKRFEKKEEK